MFRLSVMSVHAKEASANTERTILFQKKKLSDPQRRDTVNPLDRNDMLQDQADKLEQIARQTEASHGKRPEATELVAQWRASASELQKARQHCADGYKVLPPKPENPVPTHQDPERLDPGSQQSGGRANHPLADRAALG